jgi:hypothetical protein
MRLPRWLRVVGTVIGAALAIIGLAGIGDDLQTWQQWLADAGKTLGGNTGRWVLVSVGLVFIAASNSERFFRRATRSRPVVTAAPFATDEPDAGGDSASKLSTIELGRRAKRLANELRAWLQTEEGQPRQPPSTVTYAQRSAWPYMQDKRISDAYFERFGGRAVGIYEEASRRGMKDKRLKRAGNPKSRDDVVEIATYLDVLGQRLEHS